MKEVQNRVKIPLKEKRKEIVYEISCKCGKCVYVGQTQQRWDERMEEHQANIRGANAEWHAGTQSGRKRAEDRMKGHGGNLVKHVVKDCDKGINWKKSGPVAMEKGWKQRRIKESIETFKREIKGKTILNQCDYLDQGWKEILNMESSMR